MHLIHTPKCHFLGGAAALGPQLCVSESDLVLCHTEPQACLEAKFSLEGHETLSEERLRLVCTGPTCSSFKPEVTPPSLL